MPPRSAAVGAAGSRACDVFFSFTAVLRLPNPLRGGTLSKQTADPAEGPRLGPRVHAHTGPPLGMFGDTGPSGGPADLLALVRYLIVNVFGRSAKGSGIFYAKGFFVFFLLVKFALKEKK